MKRKDRGKNIAVSAFLVTAMMLSFKIIGFIKQAVIAYYFGANSITDSYFVAYGFVTGITEIVVNSVRVSIIVVYTSTITSYGKKKADALISTLLEIMMPISLLIISVISISSPLIVQLLAPSYTYDQKNVLIQFICILAPIVSLSTIELIMGAVLDSCKNFFVPRLQSLIYSTVIIVISIVASNKLGIKSLIIGQYISSVFFSIILVAVVSRNCKFQWVKFSEIKKLTEIKSVLVTAIPLVVGNGVIQINQMVDKAITTGLSEGAASALSYCHTLEQFVTNIMIVNIGNVLFSHFSSSVANKDFTAIKSILFKAINIMILLLLPISIITVLCAEDIVEIIYYRGSFNSNAVALTSHALIGYSLAFPIVAVRDFTIKSNYAFKDTKGPMMASVVAIIINIILSILLSKRLGIIGISLATGISAGIGMLINIYVFHHHVPEYSFITHLWLGIKLIPGCVGIVGLFYIINRIGVVNPMLRFGTMAFLGLPIFLVINVLLKNQQTLEIVNIVLSKIKRRKG